MWTWAWRTWRGTAQAFGFNDADLRIPFSVAPSTFDTTVDKAQLALSSIGQYNTRATPLQMAMVAAAVANGGQVRTPYLVERTTTRGGATVATPGSRPTRQAMHPATADRMKELMEDVVSEGTGTNAAIPGATVGGKTGTAQHGIGNAGDAVRLVRVLGAGRTGHGAEGRGRGGGGGRARRTAGTSAGAGMAAPIARAVMEAVLDSRE